MPSDDAIRKLLVIALVVGQGSVLWAYARRAFRFASWVGFICPLVILGVCLRGMGPRIEWSDLRLIEAAFLRVSAVNVLLSILLIRSAGRPRWLLTIVWAANSCSCAMMIY